MKRPFLTLALMLGALGAGVVSAHADTYVLTAALTGSEETPPPGLNTGAFGSATVTLDTSARTVTSRVGAFDTPSSGTPSAIRAGSR